MRFIKKIILSFCMVTVLLSSMPLCVFASDLNDGINDGYDRFMGGHNIEGFNTWESTDKKSFTLANIGSFFASIGMYFKGMSNESLMDILIEHLIESGRIADADSTDEYIASHLTANEEETELYLSNDFTNALYETSVQYIEENTGYIITKTADSKTLFKEHVQSFTTYSQYSTLLEYIEQNPDCIFWFADNLRFSNRLDPNDNSITYSSAISFYVIELKNTDLIADYYAYAKSYYVSPYDKNWQSLKLKQYCIDDSGELHSLTEYAPRVAMFLQGKDPNNPYYRYYSYQTPPLIDGITNIVLNLTGTAFLVSHGEKELRIYKSLDYLKQYSIDSRPYYITNDFSNYDSTVDNSTTITQTEIDNSVTYGDVYNYITNNYENPDGLSEDELRAILEEYLSQIGGGSGSGGSGGSDDGGSSGGGLGSFLEGLGSIGDAILSILGKLLEYIGKALELLTGTVTKVLDLIPSNVTNLLLGLFPFIPQEWITAIELSLVLGVVLAVVGAFKK